MTRELLDKERKLREMMDVESLDAVALSTVGNFAWITCGGSNYVGIASEVGAATAVVTRDARYIVCDNIEAQRIADEEVAALGFEIISFPWYDSRRDQMVREVAGGDEIGSDIHIEGARDIASVVDPLRYSLCDEEIDRYKWVGANTGECLAEACREIKPGMTEHQVAGVLNELLYARGLTPLVTLVAADDRIANYRHPIPTTATIQRTVMLVTGARKWGLIVSATRMVSFGPLPDDLQKKRDAVARIDATYIQATKPGTTAGSVVSRSIKAYADTGFPDEWKLHHQGGPTGYKGREYRATPLSNDIIVPNQAFAWNPSITGAKSEDTIIATKNGAMVLSQAGGWPMVEVAVDNKVIERPDILVR